MIKATLMLVIAFLLLASFAYANQEHEVSKSTKLDWTLAVAITLAIVHLLGAPLRCLVRKREAIVSSCGGGMAIAYVFLQLLPELDKGHNLVGNAIYFVVLIGFILFYTLEYHLPLRGSRDTAEHSPRSALYMHIIVSWIYNWLIIYTIPEQLETSIPHTAVGIIAIGLHLSYNDHILGRHYAREFDSWGRYVLASAPLAGGVTNILMPGNAMVSDLLIAGLAGAILHNVFKDELPDNQRSSFRWFVTGILVYAILLTLSTAVGE